jgi:hypothetical protein
MECVSPRDERLKGIEVLVSPDSKPLAPDALLSRTAPHTEEARSMREKLATEMGPVRAHILPWKSGTSCWIGRGSIGWRKCGWDGTTRTGEGHRRPWPPRSKENYGHGLPLWREFLRRGFGLGCRGRSGGAGPAGHPARRAIGLGRFLEQVGNRSRPPFEGLGPGPPADRESHI